MRPLGDRLARRYRFALPDIRGYGASICPEPALHRWDRYVADALAIMAALNAPFAHLIGPGLGGTVALRTSLSHPEKVCAAVIISAEAIEDDTHKAAETELMDRFAERVRTHGLHAGWDLFLPHLQPLIAHLVAEAPPRADPESAAAAAAIGHDRAFTHADELAAIHPPPWSSPATMPDIPPIPHAWSLTPWPAASWPGCGCRGTCTPPRTRPPRSPQKSRCSCSTTTAAEQEGRTVDGTGIGIGIGHRQHDASLRMDAPDTDRSAQTATHVRTERSVALVAIRRARRLLAVAFMNCPFDRGFPPGHVATCHNSACFMFHNDAAGTALRGLYGIFTEGLTKAYFERRD